MNALLTAIKCMAQEDYTDMASGLPWAQGTEGEGVEGIVILVLTYALGIAGLVAVIFLVMGGFSYITAGGNEDTTKKATKTILNAVIGLIIIFAAYAVVYTVKCNVLGMC